MEPGDFWAVRIKWQLGLHRRAHSGRHEQGRVRCAGGAEAVNAALTSLECTWVCCGRVEIGKVELKRKGKEAIKYFF